MKRLAPVMVLVGVVGSAFALVAADRLGWTPAISAVVALNIAGLVYHSAVVSRDVLRVLAGEV